MTMSLKSLIYKMLGRLIVIGKVYQGSWAASSSSANGTHLTQTLTLPAGTYVVMAHTPIMSIASLLVSFNVKAPPYKAMAGQDVFCTVLNLSAQTGVYLQSSASASVTFTYLDRGSIIAIRIA